MQAIQVTHTPHPLELELKDKLLGADGVLDFLQHGSFDGIWYHNLENPEEEWCSPEFWQLFGYDPDTKNHHASEWQRIMFPEDLAKLTKHFRRHCDDPTYPYDQILRYRHADGSTVWVRCRGMAIRDAKGKPIRMLGTHNDVTAIKQAELNALREKEKLEIANEDLKSFAYGVSHDLKSPSRTALQLIEETLLSDDGGLSEDQSQMLQGACHTLRRMQTLVEDLLDYGRVVDQDMLWQSVPLEDIVHEAMIDLQSDIIKAGARVQYAGLPVVDGHPAQLRMLVQNLISNALKFSRPGVFPLVIVTGGRTRDERAYLRVSDNGCGIPPENLDRIFHVFNRLHRHEEVPGTGIGLALCKRIAANHFGTIRVTSTVGAGSTFHVDFRNI